MVKLIVVPPKKMEYYWTTEYYVYKDVLIMWENTYNIK